MKRVFDVLFILLSLPLWLPLQLVIAVFVKYKLGHPIFFVQVRCGLNEDLFQLIKFRSMTNEIDEDGVLLSDSKRLRPFGQFLRSTSLDELPEFWNVLKGDMSLVGPRPLIPAYLARYTFRQRRRHSIKPGITGWAQVNGRNAIDWNKRFEYDIWYIEHQSMRLDLVILIKTFVNVIFRRGVSAKGHATTPEFMGNGE